MSALLTTRQAEELHKSIIAYLTACKLTKSAAALREELSIGESFDDATREKYQGLLEKKWTSVIRLQKKIFDLESRNSSLQQELDSATPTSLLRKNQDPAEWLPRSPARHGLTGHRQPVTCVAFHPIFSSLASGSEDTTIKIWDWELGELERTIKGHTKGVLDVDFGGPRGGTLLASCSSDLTIKLWDPSDEYKNIRTLPGHDHSVSAIRFIPSGAAGSPASGNLLVSASRDRTLKIWDVTTGYCVKTIRGHADWVRDVAPSFDGRWLLSGGNDQSARLWDASSGEMKGTFVGHEHVVECVAIAPPAAYEHLAKLAGLQRAPAASSSAEFVATGSRDKTIKLWDTRGTMIKSLAGHDNWVRALVFHPGGKYLLSCGDDKTIRCWDLSQEGKCVKTVENAHNHFVAGMRWAPGIVKEPQPTNGENGTTANGTAPAQVAIRCVIATACVDSVVRVFAS
ncbi:nuclear distribution protein PAC1 [Trichodelitschia bisporula]|uniref:Nuclear distribution protein PAC1 n=1 Tax=Trichodelitschia bisporula TaxID=703511 RepID=A0A6G1HYN1_9PEZI|nr:nuclear distribution protein PAC1 [Trichodelitschia bisporula]